MLILTMTEGEGEAESRVSRTEGPHSSEARLDRGVCNKPQADGSLCCGDCPRNKTLPGQSFLS